MKTFKIKNANELHNFLKVLAEESITQARTGLSSEKDRQSQMMKQIRQDKSRFMREEDPPDAAGAEPKADEEPPPEKPAEKPAALSSPEISPKYESLVDAINSLRGAGSTRDSTVDAQLRAYYDKLDSAECAALIVMLRSVTDVMTGVIPGDQAKDPSNYKIKVTMEKNQSSAPEEPETEAPEPEGEETPEEPAESEAEPEEEENTSPPQKLPINVGQGMTEAYRNKIRALLRNS